MAVYSRLEFSDLLQMNPRALSVYIGNGAVEVNKKDQIDTSVLKNEKFMTDRQKKLASGKVKPFNRDGSETSPVTGVTPKPTQTAQTISAAKAAAMDLEKEMLEIEKLKETNRYLRTKADKAEGLVIPTDLVKSLLLQHSKSIANNFKQALEESITLMAAKFGASSEDMQSARKGVLEKLNAAIEGSVQETKKEIQNIVNEYSAVKGIGEKV